MKQVFLYPNILLWIHEAEWKHSVKEPGIWQHFLKYPWSSVLWECQLCSPLASDTHMRLKQQLTPQLALFSEFKQHF